MIVAFRQIKNHSAPLVRFGEIFLKRNVNPAQLINDFFKSREINRDGVIGIQAANISDDLLRVL